MRSELMLQCLKYSRAQLGALSQAQRYAATQSSPKHVDPAKYQEQVNEYHRGRAAWKRQMTELRKQWMHEHTEKLASADARAAAERDSRIQAQRDEADRSAKDAGYEARLLQLRRQVENAELAHEVAVDRLKRAERASLRQQILQEQESARFDGIVEQSKSWITREQLDQAINAVLDTPASLDPPPPPTEEQQTL